MCYIEAYYILHPTGYDDSSSGGFIPLTYGSTTHELLSLGNTLNSIDSWLQSFDKNCS